MMKSLLVIFVVVAAIVSARLFFGRQQFQTPATISIPVERADGPEQVDTLRPKRSLLAAVVRGKETAKQSLSVPPKAAIPAPAAASDRPAWIDAPPDRVGDAFQMAVSVGPYPTLVQCDKELPAAVRDAIQDYAENHLDYRARGLQLELDNLESLPNGVIAETYHETVSTSFGPMQQLHARLTFDHRACQWVREQIRDALVAYRVRYVGGAFAGVLAALAMLWVWLKSGRRPEVSGVAHP